MVGVDGRRFAEPMVWFGWQARYYSATLALTVLSGLAIWALTRRGTWRDAAVTGLALMLLFHTHSLSFLILTGVLLVNVPFGIRQPQWVSKLLLTGAIVACGIVPWMYWTNYFHAATRIPMAWPLLAVPERLHFVVCNAQGVRRRDRIDCGVDGCVRRFPSSAVRPANHGGRERPSRVLLRADVVCHRVLSFLLLIPAASFFSGRLMLVLAVPGYLLFALCIALASRATTPRFAVLVAPLIVLVFLGVRGTAIFKVPHRMVKGVEAFADVASHWTLEAGTKLYAWPNQNLVLTYYTGLPVQSIAPVRKKFLDEYPGDVILIETGTPYVDPPSTEERTSAGHRGSPTSADDERQAILRIQRYGAVGTFRVSWQTSGRRPSRSRRSTRRCSRIRSYTQQEGRKNAEQFLLLRGFDFRLMLSSQWLPAFYWYVNPETRLGDQLNYGKRVRSATGIVLPNGSIIFDARRNRDVPLVDRAQYLALLRLAYPFLATIRQTSTNLRDDSE